MTDRFHVVRVIVPRRRAPCLSVSFGSSPQAVVATTLRDDLSALDS